MYFNNTSMGSACSDVMAAAATSCPGTSQARCVTSCTSVQTIGAGGAIQIEDTNHRCTDAAMGGASPCLASLCSVNWCSRACALQCKLAGDYRLEAVELAIQLDPMQKIRVQMLVCTIRSNCTPRDHSLVGVTQAQPGCGFVHF